MEQGLSRLGRVAQRLLEKVAGLLPTIAAAVMVLVVSWALAGLARQAARFGTRYVESPTRRNLIRQLAHYTVTGIGLGGGALGFALKDSLSNFVSGLLILLSRTFEINDQIVVGETEGTVERIEFRATHIRTYDGRLVLVPNGEVFTSRATNNTASPLGLPRYWFTSTTVRISSGCWPSSSRR